eukprot:403331558
MWQRELEPDYDEEEEDEKIEGRVGSKDAWYKKQVEYWSTQEASINGVLSGYGDFHNIDQEVSNKILDQYKSTMGSSRALDCGAGIGRITKFVLEPRFDKIDLMEPTASLLDKAKEFIGSDKVDNYYCKGLQDFEFEHKYDCIWVQWVFCYLTDEDLIIFLKKCSENMIDSNSLLVAKENVHDEGFYVDKEDNSVVRSDKIYQEIFEEAGFMVVKQQYQPGFPEDLFNISIYVLKRI